MRAEMRGIYLTSFSTAAIGTAVSAGTSLFFGLVTLGVTAFLSLRIFLDIFQSGGWNILIVLITMVGTGLLFISLGVATICLGRTEFEQAENATTQ